jgi:hypothetical protein
MHLNKKEIDGYSNVFLRQEEIHAAGIKNNRKGSFFGFAQL